MKYSDKDIGSDSGPCLCKQGAKYITLFSCLLFIGIYLMPEYIKIFAIVFTGMMTVYYFIYSEGFYISRSNLLWCIYILAGCWGIVLYRNSSFTNAVEFVVSLLIGIIANSMLMNKHIRKKQLQALLIVVFVVLLGCSLQLFTPNLLAQICSRTLGTEQYIANQEFVSWRRIVGFSYQTGVTAHYLCIYELFVLGWFFSTKRTEYAKKIMYCVQFVIGFILILFTEKRSSLLAILLVAVILYVLVNRKNVVKILCAILLMSSMFGIIITCTELGRKMLTRTLGSNPLTGRLKIYETLWTMVKKSPVLGNGFGSTLVEVTEFTNGHNIYLQSFAECGFIGVSILIIILFGCCYKAIKVLLLSVKIQKVTCVEVFCAGYQIYFIIVGFIGNGLYDIYPLVAYMITTGIVHSICAEQCETFLTLDTRNNDIEISGN